ncbi:MAG: hypothetical protein PWQ55_1709 [Chloroflexota bacterium]|nr:hypothetical protein [Chloroflexota bacterium]
MKKNSSLFLVFALAVLVIISGCQPVSIYTQRATATAYSADYMTTAMQAAEDGAMALCNIDFNDQADGYIQQVCDASTKLGCDFFNDQINQAWNDLERAYSSDQLECTLATSRYLDEGEQFGMHVQYWQVNLQGTKGWTAGSTNREYWLQVAEEDSQWKLNRVLTSDEIAYYAVIDSLGAEE